MTQQQDLVVAAQAGEQISTTTHHRHQTVTALEKCDQNKGQWFCVTHQCWFDNQLQKDIHINNPSVSHRLAWNCFAHGIETP